MAPACYGFSVRSEEPLRFARNGGGQDALMVARLRGPAPVPGEAPLAEWVFGDGRARARLYAGGGVFTLWTSDVGWFRMAPADGTVEIPADGDEIRREQLLWTLPAMTCAEQRGDLAIHATGAEVDGEALLLAADDPASAAALALGFHCAGFRVLGDSGVRVRRPSGTAGAMLFPGAATLRVPDALIPGTPAGMTFVAAAGGSVLLALDADARGDGTPLPLRALVVVDGGARDAARLRPDDAFAALWPLVFHTHEEASQTRALAGLRALVGAVPAWRMAPPGAGDLEDAAERLVRAS
jgi:hypothetical protein